MLTALLQGFAAALFFAVGLFAIFILVCVVGDALICRFTARRSRAVCPVCLEYVRDCLCRAVDGNHTTNTNAKGDAE